MERKWGSETNELAFNRNTTPKIINAAHLPGTLLHLNKLQIAKFPF